MGGHDYCAIPNCPNARHIIHRQIKADHVGWLRWHKARLADRKEWTRQICLYRKNFKMTENTRVCSNHFAAGYYADHCNIPTLYMKGYDTSEGCGNTSKKRKEPANRVDIEPPIKRTKNINRDGSEDVSNPENIQTPAIGEHDYDHLIERDQSARCISMLPCKSCVSKSVIIQTLSEQIQKLETEIIKLKESLEKTANKPFTVDDLSNDNKMVNTYTGFQNIEVFTWVHERIKDKAKCLIYNKNLSSRKLKKRKRKLSTKDEFFLTLVRLRLGLTERDIAFRFKVSQSTVSSIWNTWIPFLARELSCFIYWPTQEENQRCYPKCFAKYPNTIGIIDCTEGAIEKPSIAKAQAQTYSSYKSKNTWKKLLCITPCGTVSFVSKAYGGSASDRHITESCNLLQKVNPGDVIMADKGFNISDLLVGKGAKLVIPPFLKDKGRFAKKNCRETSSIAKARIHVERAIARIKDFRILNGTIPITMKDLLDDIFVIICAITNIAPPLVPL